MVCLTCNTCTCTSPIPTSTEVDDWDRNTYLGSADRRWGKVICVQQLSWQSKTPISILLINAISAPLKIPGNFIGTIIRPQIQGVHSNSGATRPSVLSPSNMPLTDVIYFAVSTFYLLFHCQNEKKNKVRRSGRKELKKCQKKKEGRFKTTAFGITQNLSVTVLKVCFSEMFQIKMSMFMLSWPQIYGFRSIFPQVPDLHTFFTMHGCKPCLIKVRMWQNCADFRPQFSVVGFLVLFKAKCMAKL